MNLEIPFSLKGRNSFPGWARIQSLQNPAGKIVQLRFLRCQVRACAGRLLRPTDPAVCFDRNG